ncbi:unnamed protein product [Oppiella nova]|uniref:non-specific serine/threonine protein kinase n=1 Tax=Oppiella nova TaxID=334625 RepID=A0A7R9M2F1_9ACAR|nr:unnamed protein product [Oppiella nova]CAG2169377.1 unnamed protein product [Oppiella nova]
MASDLEDYPELSDLFVQSERMSSEFHSNTQQLIREGYFGQVFKVTNILDGNDYVVNIITIKENIGLTGTLRESSWLETSHKGKDLVLTVHIQMDLWWFTLEEAIHKMRTHFDRQVNQFLPTLGYYMASELFVEILEAIDYLHSREPPIMHRDIQPKNILIKGSPYGKFVKLADLDPVPGHLKEYWAHTSHASGCTDNYMAPEFRVSRYYGTKADMYSIGATVNELFNFDQYSLFLSLSHCRVVHNQRMITT